VRYPVVISFHSGTWRAWRLCVKISYPCNQCHPWSIPELGALCGFARKYLIRGVNPGFAPFREFRS
jgi:hypothetical protein